MKGSVESMTADIRAWTAHKQKHLWIVLETLSKNSYCLNQDSTGQFTRAIFLAVFKQLRGVFLAFFFCNFGNLYAVVSIAHVHDESMMCDVNTFPSKDPG